jgi:hypothetical protein
MGGRFVPTYHGKKLTGDTLFADLDFGYYCGGRKIRIALFLSPKPNFQAILT